MAPTSTSDPGPGSSPGAPRTDSSGTSAVVPKTRSPSWTRHPSGTRTTTPDTGSTCSEPAATWICGDSSRGVGSWKRAENTQVPTAATTASTRTPAISRIVRARADVGAGLQSSFVQTRAKARTDRDVHPSRPSAHHVVAPRRCRAVEDLGHPVIGHPRRAAEHHQIAGLEPDVRVGPAPVLRGAEAERAGVPQTERDDGRAAGLVPVQIGRAHV